MWHGFTFNPTLKRLIDYKKTKKYGSITHFNNERPYESEAAIGKFYKNIGFRAAILNQGFCRHIGEGRQILR